MSRSKQLFIESTAVCPVCGERYDNKHDLQSIRLYGYCRKCILLQDR